jgi:hypothetical protein
MMTIELSEDEVKALMRLIDAHLPELEWEVARSEQRDYRKTMVHDEGVLVELRRRLRPTA